MGEWEDIFGEGVSAESVIDGINSSWKRTWDAEQEQTKKQARNQAKAKLTAYLGSKKLKAQLIHHLTQRLEAAQRASHEKGLLSFVFPNDDGFAELEAHHRIPQSLAHILEAVSLGLRRKNLYHSPNERLDKLAAEWLIRCFDVIQPGVDLRLVAPKFAANMARIGFSLTRKSPRETRDKAKEVNKACAPALDIIYARARGVLVQEHLVIAAAQSALNAVSTEWTDGLSGYDSIDDFRAVIMASAVGLEPSSASDAAYWTVLARWECHEYGYDAGQNSYWEDCSKKLIDMIKSSPTDRLRIIDLNKVY